MSSLADRRAQAPASAVSPHADRLPCAAAPAQAPRWSRWTPSIFAAKTTASGLLALLVAFTFDLDQPKWALLTVFIVAQPQSGLVLAKSFYRMIGTVVGAIGALVLVSLFAQERELFLGTLAIWIGVCTFASVRARNFAAYGFVLSGYTAAIVGITGALDPGNTFFIAVARVTEISVGLMTTAAISHLVLPVSLADSVRHVVETARTGLADWAAELLAGRESRGLRTELLADVIAIENLRASVIFESRDIRERSGALQRLDAAMLQAVDAAGLLARSLECLGRDRAVAAVAMERAMRTAGDAIDAWRRGALDSRGLRRRFIRASAHLPLARDLFVDASASDHTIVRGAAAISRVRELLSTLAIFADAHESFVSPQVDRVAPVRFAVPTDLLGAASAGARAAIALVVVGTFWILADWPSGVTATILAAVVTARLATMEHAIRAAKGGTVVVLLAALPCFVLVEVLLPCVAGFTMFAIVIAPMLFGCAYLMAHEKTAGIGFIAALYFANAAGFQNRMAYDPVGFLNASIAIALAIASAALLFTMIAPDTPEAARRRFVRIARKIFARIARRRAPIGPVELETALAEALDQLRRGLRRERSEDLAALEAGIALLGVGRELVRLRQGGRATPAKAVLEHEVVRLAQGESGSIDRLRRVAAEASAACLADLRKDGLGRSEARAAAREMVAFAAIADELERGGDLLLRSRIRGGSLHVA